MTKITRWNLWKAALYGAGLGVLILLVRVYLLGERLPEDSATQAGYWAGSLLGAALLFVLIAAIRNLVVRLKNP